jgi:SHS2 domain-containing protein
MVESGFEYLDHPADVQIHSWGPTFERALEPLCIGLFGIMMDPEGFGDSESMSVSVKGADILSLVHAFLDEWLFLFDSKDFVVKRIEVVRCDLTAFEIDATAYGEEFDMDKHADFRRTEVKAITYASMKVDQTPDRADVFVIVDL